MELDQKFRETIANFYLKYSTLFPKIIDWDKVNSRLGLIRYSSLKDYFVQFSNVYYEPIKPPIKRYCPYRERIIRGIKLLKEEDLLRYTMKRMPLHLPFHPYNLALNWNIFKSYVKVTQAFYESENFAILLRSLYQLCRSEKKYEQKTSELYQRNSLVTPEYALKFPSIPWDWKTVFRSVGVLPGTAEGILSYFSGLTETILLDNETYEKIWREYIAVIRPPLNVILQFPTKLFEIIWNDVCFKVTVNDIISHPDLAWRDKILSGTLSQQMELEDVLTNGHLLTLDISSIIKGYHFNIDNALLYPHLFEQRGLINNIFGISYNFLQRHPDFIRGFYFSGDKFINHNQLLLIRKFYYPESKCKNLFQVEF